MAHRQTTGFVESLLRLDGLHSTVTDISTLSRRQKALSVHIPYRSSTGPLHQLIDSTGIKVESGEEWHAPKHGDPKQRAWRKIHLEIDEERLKVRAWRSRGARSPIRRCYPASSNRSQRTSGYAASPRMAPTILKVPRRDHRSRCPRSHPTPRERQTVGDGHCRWVRRNEAHRTAKNLGSAICR